MEELVCFSEPKGASRDCGLLCKRLDGFRVLGFRGFRVIVCGFRV